MKGFRVSNSRVVTPSHPRPAALLTPFLGFLTIWEALALISAPVPFTKHDTPSRMCLV